MYFKYANGAQQTLHPPNCYSEMRLRSLWVHGSIFTQLSCLSSCAHFAIQCHRLYFAEWFPDWHGTLSLPRSSLQMLDFIPCEVILSVFFFSLDQCWWTFRSKKNIQVNQRHLNINSVIGIGSFLGYVNTKSVSWTFFIEGVLRL